MIYYTHDEWGKTVCHIMSGQEGIEVLKKVGIGNNQMTDEEYDRHMKSHNKIQERKLQQVQKWIEELIELLDPNK